ncbi:MAG: PAS domain-containing sensor histidine kinase [Simkania sp.]|nr:PAS domain-containing sensor histidine kinase [Simkania sp.]
MTWEAFFKNSCRNIGMGCAWTVTLLSAFFVVCWQVGLYSFLTLPFFDWPLPYSTSICLLLSGLGFLNIIYPTRLPLYRGLAVLIVFLSGIRLVEIVFQIDLGLSAILIKTLIRSPQEFSYMQFVGACNLLLISTALALWPWKKRTQGKSFLVFSIAFIVIFVAAEAVIIHVLPLQPSYLTQQIPIHFLAAAIQTMISIGLICWGMYVDSIQNIEVSRKVPIIIFGGVLFFHVFLVLGILQGNKIVAEEGVHSKAEMVKTISLTKLEELSHILYRISRRIEASQHFDASWLMPDIKYIMLDERLIQRIGWTDADFSIQQSFSQNEKSTTSNSMASHLRKNFSDSLDNQTVMADFSPENHHLGLYNPLYWGGQFQGVVFFDVNLSLLFYEAMCTADLEGYSVSIFYDHSEIYTNAPKALQSVSSRTYESSLVFANVEFLFHFAPTEQFLVTRLGNVLCIVISVMGGVGSVLTASIMYLLLEIRKKTIHEEKIRKQLQASESFMRAMNEAGTVLEATQNILGILHKEYGWQLFLYWQWNKKKKVMELIQYVEIPDHSFPTFEKASRELTTSEFALFLSSFKDRRVAWFKDFAQETLPRSSAAKKDEIKGTFILPVYERNELTGVLELFQTDPLLAKPEGEWLIFMNNMGSEFSLFVERRRIEAIQKELTAIVTASVDPIYTLDCDLRIQRWNLAAERLYGWTEEEIQGKSVSELYPFDRMQEGDVLRRICLEKKVVEHFETQHLCKDKTLVWVDVAYSIIFNENGDLVSIAVITQDIRKQKEVLLALQRSEEKLRSFVEMTNTWIWEMDLSLKYTYSNSVTKAILGYDPDQVLGKEMTSLSFNKEKISEEMEKCLHGQKGWNQRIWQVLHKSGSSIYLESNGEPIFNEKGVLSGFRGADRDVTERMTIERSKNEFISMVSHELRTPLTSIMGALGLLRVKEGVSIEIKELIVLAARNAERLSSIINDILDIEKVELGKLRLALKPIVLIQAVREAVELSKPLAASYRITLIEEVVLPSVQIFADYDRLVQVILNLFSNAIKFSFSGGKVIVRMEILGEKVRVSVVDQGRGIPIKAQEKIFGRFVQAEGGDARIKGTGLGLNISRSIVKQMGGEIGFISSLNIGSTFYFEFPIIK